MKKNKPQERRFGIVGFPLSYTCSPQIHSKIFKKKKIMASYEVLRFDPSSGKKGFFRFLDGLFFKEGFLGINVTVPFKKWAFDYSDGFCEGENGLMAKKSRACNTLVRKKNRVLCANTDALGFWSDALLWLGSQRQKEFDVAIVGKGGAAQALLAGIDAFLKVKKSARQVVCVTRTKNVVLKRGLKKKSDCLLVAWCVPELAKKEAQKLWMRSIEGHQNVFLIDLNYGKKANVSKGFISKNRRRDGLAMLMSQAISSNSIFEKALREK